MVWAKESNELAWSVVYTAPQAPTPVPESYISQNMLLAQQRVALGGYRLGALLDYIVQTAPPNTTLAGAELSHADRLKIAVDAMTEESAGQGLFVGHAGAAPNSAYLRERTRRELSARLHAATSTK
jgi:hypothetical protein